MYPITNNTTRLASCVAARHAPLVEGREGRQVGHGGNAGLRRNPNLPGLPGTEVFWENKNTTCNSKITLWNNMPFWEDILDERSRWNCRTLWPSLEGFQRVFQPCHICKIRASLLTFRTVEQNQNSDKDSLKMAYLAISFQKSHITNIVLRWNSWKGVTGPLPYCKNGFAALYMISSMLGNIFSCHWLCSSFLKFSGSVNLAHLSLFSSKYRSVLCRERGD